MKKINCFGDFCPIPLLKAQNACRELQKDESFVLVSDHSCTVETISEYFEEGHYDLNIDEVIDGIWEITFTRID